VYYKHYSITDGPYISHGTNKNYVPYDGAYKKGQQFLGENLVQDMASVINDFKPNLVITTGPKDAHPDHGVAFFIVQRVKQILGENWPIYTSIVHYKNYPPKGGHLTPPRPIFGTNWFSLDLTEDEQKLKLESLVKHASQYANPVDREIFIDLSARNEIFEKY
jgi:LmbE family N-acetylglucosaminyl deacetylase